jgi:hypothetical protein
MVRDVMSLLCNHVTLEYRKHATAHTRVHMRTSTYACEHSQGMCPSRELMDLVRLSTASCGTALLETIVAAINLKQSHCACSIATMQSSCSMIKVLVFTCRYG